MKIDELLCKSTITSSRTLTIYSATVMAILFTQTELKALPGIGFLSGTEATRYVIVLAVLVFMISVHSINFWNDIYVSKTGYAYKNIEKLKAALHKEFTAHNEPTQLTLQNFADFAAQLQKTSNRLSWLAREGLHFIVPMLLAVPTCVVLAWKVYSLTPAIE